MPAAVPSSAWLTFPMMSFRPYPAPAAARFDELADLFHAARQAFRDSAQETEWRAAANSAAARDQEKLVHHDPPFPEGTEYKITKLLYFYMFAASEHLGALGALYASREVLIPPATLIRAILEHCASSMWVLQRAEGPMEDRLARAYLEELMSAEEAKKASGRLLGKDNEEYRIQAAKFKDLRDEAKAVFGESPVDEKGRTSIRSQRRLGPLETVGWMLGFTSQPLTEKAATGVYDYLSNLSHPTLYPHSQMWGVITEGNQAQSSANGEDRWSTTRVSPADGFMVLHPTGW
ncbi:MAG: hypothetical protein ACLP01_10050 [Solirubrobacteraceae bacterium]